jgi:hypothetical protein
MLVVSDASVDYYSPSILTIRFILSTAGKTRMKPHLLFITSTPSQSGGGGLCA